MHRNLHQLSCFGNCLRQQNCQVLIGNRWVCLANRWTAPSSHSHVVTTGAARHGQGGALAPPWKCANGYLQPQSGISTSSQHSLFICRYPHSTTNIILTRDVNETLAYETETRPRRLIFATRRDRDRDLARPRQRRFSRPSTFRIVPKQWMATFKLKLFI